MDDCVFCKIIRGDIPSPRLYEDDDMIIIRDIDPKAKLHYLMIPKKHYRLLSEMDADDVDALGRCFKKVGELTETLGFENGYRLIINQGEDAGQTVFHLHVHLLGGQKMDFPAL